MAREYPKEVKVKDGSTIVLKPFEKKDKDALFLFFQKLPEGDRLFLKDNVTDPAVVERWAVELNYDKVFPLLAWRGKEVVGDATPHQNTGGGREPVRETRGGKKAVAEPGCRQEAPLPVAVRGQSDVRPDVLDLSKYLEDFWANIQTHEYFSYPSRPMEG